MKTIILAGGLGTRLSEETALRPKPMVEVGSQPILWHILNIYSAAGYSEFIVALGYRGEVIKSYFRDYLVAANDITVQMDSGGVEVRSHRQPPWTVHLVDTGATTQTGGRIRRLREWIGDETFMLTYGDGVADVDLKALVNFHREHGRLATLTAVRPPARFGGLQLNGDSVTGFQEKPVTEGGWINGGFFVLEPRIFDYLDGDDTIWERAPLSRLAAEGQLRAFMHNGFFQPMDTLREKRLLDELWTSGAAPWKLW